MQGDVTNDQLIITNDLVEFKDANTFIWLGRIDNTVNTGGYKVQLEKVEVQLAQALLALGISCRSFVTSVPDAKLGDMLVAVLETKPLAEETLESLQQEITRLLPKYERPKKIFYTKKFSTTHTGKVDKAATLRNISAPIL